MLKTAQDERILEKIKNLEKRRLTAFEKKVVALCKSQLEDDWRAPLENFVDGLLKK
ncbi:MAG: hypothetical protein AB1626_06075 [Candidatus Micrarchaeota archaeon]